MKKAPGWVPFFMGCSLVVFESSILSWLSILLFVTNSITIFIPFTFTATNTNGVGNTVVHGVADTILVYIRIIAPAIATLWMNITPLNQ